MNEEKPKIYCQKCQKEIGGEAYHFLQFDCMYDGKTLTNCKNATFCSNCYKDVKSFSKLPTEPTEGEMKDIG